MKASHRIGLWLAGVGHGRPSYIEQYQEAEKGYRCNSGAENRSKGDIGIFAISIVGIFFVGSYDFR